MISTAPIGWFNTGMPLVILAVLAWLLPRIFASSETRSHRSLLIACVIAAFCILLVGIAIFAIVYSLGGADVMDAVSLAPVALGLFFLKMSVMAAIVWAPILVLVWYSKAQMIEQLRGEDIARGAA